MTKTAIEILSLGVSLAALLGTVVVVDWPLIREWWADRKFRRAVTRWERSHKAQALDQARYEALAALARREALMSGKPPADLADWLVDSGAERAPKAKHPWDSIPYDLRTAIHPDPMRVDDRKKWN